MYRGNLREVRLRWKNKKFNKKGSVLKNAFSYIDPI